MTAGAIILLSTSGSPSGTSPLSAEQPSYPIAAHRSLWLTTIQLRQEIRARLNGVTVHPRESYDGTLNRLPDMTYDPEPLSEETLKIEGGIADIRAGRYRSLEDSAQEPSLE